MKTRIFLVVSILGMLLCLVSCDGPTPSEPPTPAPTDTLASTEATEPPPLSQVRYWAYQIQGVSEPSAVDKLANSHYDMLDPYLDYNSVIDEVIRDGFDGIYLDWVEGFENDAVIAEAHSGIAPSAR